MTMDTGKSLAKYVKRLCALSNRLTGLNVDALMRLFAMMEINHLWYGGIVSQFAPRDPPIFNADLTSLEMLMTAEVVRRKAIGLNGEPSNDSANRFRRDKKPIPAKTPAPASSSISNLSSYPPKSVKCIQ